MSNEAQSVFLTKIISLILGSDPYFCKSDSFEELFVSDYFSNDKEQLKSSRRVTHKDDYYVYCLEFVSSYGFYIEDLFNKEYFKKERLSEPLKSSLGTICKIVNLRHEDQWETIHHNIIERLNPDPWFHNDKKDWIVSLLDDETSALLKDYFKAIAY